MFRKATPTDIPDIISLSKISWRHTYVNIISQEQINYMLALFYEEPVLHSQFQDSKHHFWVLLHDEKIIAYAHCIEDANDDTLIKLSKIYFQPEYQGKGYGKSFLLNVENECRLLGKEKITLNVNRKNPARFFYQKMNYNITQEIDIPLHTFWLNDYIMQKEL